MLANTNLIEQALFEGSAMDTAPLPSPTDQTICLQDGRTLGYAQYGSSDGKTVFYFHGHPGSRLEARFLASQAAQAGICLIGVDRPGMGLSSYQAGRRLLDFPDDIVGLAHHLRRDQFAVVGFSGGGPYALACACKIPQYLTACGIVAGVGHLNPYLSFLSQWFPWLVLPISRRFFRDEKQAGKTLLRFAQQWVVPDQNCLHLPEIRELMAASLVEALRPGAKGAAYDGVLLGRSWGFKLEDVKFSSLYLWHGELDKEVPVARGREIAESLPHCTASYYPGEGHISLIVNHSKEILASMTAD